MQQIIYKVLNPCQITLANRKLKLITGYKITVNKNTLMTRISDFYRDNPYRFLDLPENFKINQNELLNLAKNTNLRFIEAEQNT